jgi:hypothetical protein
MWPANDELVGEEQLAGIFGLRTKDSLDRRSFFPVVGVGLMALAPGAAGAQPGERAGSVEDIKGEAFAEAASERRRLAHAAPIFIADQVGTESESGWVCGSDVTRR